MRAWIVRGIAFAALLFPPRPALAQEAPPVLKNSIFCISIPDLGKTWSALDRTPVAASVAALMGSQAVQSFPEWAGFLAAKAAREKALGFSTSPDSLFGPILQGISISSGPQEAGAARPKLLIALQVKDTAKFKKIFESMEEQIRAAAGKGARVAEKYRSADLITFEPSSGVPAYAAQFGDKFVLSNRKELAKQAIDGGGSELGQPPASQTAQSQLQSKAPDIRYFMESALIQKAVGAETAVEGGNYALVDTFLEHLFGGVERSAGAITVSPQEILLERADVVATEAAGPTAHSARTAPSSLPLMKYASESAWIASASNKLDIALLLKSWRELISAKGDAQAQTDLKGEMSQIESYLGASLERDVAPAIGPQVVVSLNGIELGPAPAVDLTLGVQIRDAGKALSILKTVEVNVLKGWSATAKDPSQAPKAFTGEEYKGAKIRHAPRPGTSSFLSYAVDGETLLFNIMNPDSLKKAIDCSRGGRPTAAANERLAALASRFNHPDSNQVIVVNIAQLVADLRQMFLPVIQMAAAQSPAQAQAIQGLLDGISTIRDFAQSSRWNGQVVHSAAALTMGGPTPMPAR